MWGGGSKCIWMHMYFNLLRFCCCFFFAYQPTYLCPSQQELQIPATEDAMVFNIAGHVDSTCPVDSSMNFCIGMNDIQISFLILVRKHKPTKTESSHNAEAYLSNYPPPLHNTISPAAPRLP